MAQMLVAYWVQLGRVRSAGNDLNAKEDGTKKARTLADAMFTKNPRDRRAINAYVGCMVNDLTRAKDPITARGDAEKALRIVDAALVFSPKDQSMLLLRAQVEQAFADLATNADERNEHMRLARTDFVNALREGTWFLTSTSQVNDLYAGFSENDKDSNFYREVSTAVNKALGEFPHVPAFQTIAADASRHLGRPAGTM
jgi:hypothetical protein